MPPYLKSAVVYKICIHLAFQRFSADYGLSTDYVCECVCEFVSVCLSFYNMLLPSLKVTNAGYEWCAIVRSQWKFPAHQHSQKNLEFALYSINFFGGLPTSRNIRGSQVFRTKLATLLISGEFFPGFKMHEWHLRKRIRKVTKSPSSLRSGSPHASIQRLHRPISQSPLQFDVGNIKQTFWTWGSCLATILGLPPTLHANSPVGEIFRTQNGCL